MRRADLVLMVLVGSAGCSEPTAPIPPAPPLDTGAASTTGTPGTASTASMASTASTSNQADSTGEIPVGPGLSLVDPEAWIPALADEDPFGRERPDPVECALGWGEESGVFEVDADLCLYGAFVQPTRAAIHQGDTVELVMLHDALYAVDPAQAHVAIAFGDQIAWETTLPIPSEPALLRPSWTATADVPEGSPVHFHVHNHGVNNYRVVDLTVAGP